MKLISKTIQPPHFSQMRNSPQAMAHYSRVVLTMPRRANDNNPNMPTYEG